MDKKILIPIIVILVLGIGVFSWHYFIRPVEEPVVVEDPAPVENDVLVEDDEMIITEFCRRAITKAQLKDITGKEAFIFEDTKERIPGIDVAIETCNIRLAELIEDEAIGIEMEARAEIIIGFFPLNFTYEEVYEQMKRQMAKPDIMALMPKGIREVEDVGEKAFSVSMEGVPALEVLELLEDIEGVEIPAEVVEDIVLPEMHQIVFLEPDTNQVIGVAVQEFSYEVLITIARRVEANIK